MIAFDAADATGKTAIWLRPLDALESRPLPGHRRRAAPDLVARQPLDRLHGRGKAAASVAVAGGPAQTIGDAPHGADGSWSPDGVILLDGRGNDPLWMIDAGGGVRKPLVTPDAAKGERGAGWPAFLPDGRHFLYHLMMAEPRRRTRSGCGTLDTGETARRSCRSASQVVFAPPGYLLFVRDRTLVAQRFDASALELRGDPIPLGEGLGVGDLGLVSISASTTGSLAYRPGLAAQRRLVWIDRNGKEKPALDQDRDYADAWLSPDGSRLVFDVGEDNNKGDLWIRDFARGTTTRFTFEPESEFAPIWSPDGKRIAYSAQHKGWDLYGRTPPGRASRSRCWPERRGQVPDGLVA